MRGLGLVMLLAIAGSAIADTRHSSRVPPAGRYRFTFDLSYPDSGSRVAKGTYGGVLVVARDGTLSISSDAAGKKVIYRGPFARSIPWRRGMRLVLMRDKSIALHDDHELLYGCGTYEDDNGEPCIANLDESAER